MDIEFLAEHPESIPLLVDLYETEWAPYYGADGPGDALSDLRLRCNRDQIPAGILAVENGEILGTAALGELLLGTGWRYRGDARFHDGARGVIYVKDL